MAGRTEIRVEGFDSMEWTSLREYRKPPSKRFEWMETAKGFDVVGLPDTTAGRRRYIECLETLVDWSKPTEAGKVLWEGQSLQSTLRRGWYFGSQRFREKLLDGLGRDGLEADRKTRKRYTRADLKDMIWKWHDGSWRRAWNARALRRPTWRTCARTTSGRPSLRTS